MDDDRPDGGSPGPWHASVREERPAPTVYLPYRRRWPWIVALLFAVGLAATAGGIAYEQREVAAQWRDRATELEAQRDAAVDRSDVASGRLDEFATLLRDSERDVIRLEGRLRALADEKARAEDTVTTVQVERGVFFDVTSRIVAATDLLDACVAQLFTLQTASVDAFNRTTAGEPVYVTPLNRQARQVTDACNDARSAAASPGSAADRLLAP